ncbi:MAG: hypothetical protein K2N48_10515 [Muribaculaceae bacterium]|nr:hypothetical protein [Muribaculaceae bacterium]
MPVKRLAFCKLLKSQYVPYYAYPRFRPSEATEFYQFGKIERFRKLTGIVPREEMAVIKPSLQIKTWERFMKMGNIPDATIVISSEVTDYLAIQAAALLNWRWINLFPNSDWRWFIPSHTVKEFNREASFIFIRSILPDKAQAVNILDLINKHPRALKVLVVGGMQGIDYTDTYLHIPVHMAFHIEGTREKLPPAIRVSSSVEVEHANPALTLNWSKELASLKVLRKDD